jgi:outer membrane protein OmpA-like peptidoglycan-associated protein
MTAHHRDTDREHADSSARIWQLYADELGIPDPQAAAGNEPLAAVSDGLGSRLGAYAKSVGVSLGVLAVVVIAIITGTALWSAQRPAAPIAFERPAPATPDVSRVAPPAAPAITAAVPNILVADTPEDAAGFPYQLNFEFASERITAESKQTLTAIVALMKTHPDWRLTIEGHTDAQGTSDYNQALSVRRAEAVKAYLESADIAPGRLRSLGFGASRPAAPGNTTQASLNRRVNIHLR